MHFFISCVLFLLLTTSCAGKEIYVKINRDDIQGNINNHSEVTVFDGTGLKAIPVSINKFSGQRGITSNCYGVIFFTRQGYNPEAIIFKAQDKPVVIADVSLVPLSDPGKGVLTGVVYKPVTGGKLQEHKGIVGMYKGERLSIVKEGVVQEVITDDNGVFMIELLPGEYDIVFNKINVYRVLIEKGRTTLENIQKGTLLVD